jgi:hypothetical protein
VLYVNNIRSYYNILKWLTANEEQPELGPFPELDEQPEIEVEIEKPAVEEPIETA